MSLPTFPSRRRRTTSTPRLAALLGVLAALIGAAAAVARRRRSAGASGPSPARPGAGDAPARTPAAEAVERTYTCECGEEYRVSGEDRHRVYWRKDADLGDPVLSQACPNCDRPLPHDHSVTPG